jgi:transposase
MAEYVGFDVSKEETAFCVKNKDGAVLARGKTLTDPMALFDTLKTYTLCPERIVLETGTMSAWLARELRHQGMPVDVIDARQAHAVMKLQHNKTDANDAELLAEIARTGFCRPAAVSSEAAQEKRILLKARNHLVRQRRDTENTIRGLLGSLGIRFPKGADKLYMRVRSTLCERTGLLAMIEPLLSCIDTLKQEINRLDAAVLAQAKVCPSCRLLMSVPRICDIPDFA